MNSNLLFPTYFYVWVLLIIEDPTVIVMIWFMVFSATFNSVLIGWNFQRSLETTQPMLLIYWVNDARVNLQFVFNHVFSSEEKVLTYFPIRSFVKDLKLVENHLMNILTISQSKYHHQCGRYWYINIFSQLLNWTHTTGMVCVVSSAKRVLFCLAWSGKNQTWLPWIIFCFWLAHNLKTWNDLVKGHHLCSGTWN
jgi:hypothetical protein